MSRTAVVILNWNGKNFLEKFLPYLIKFTPKEDGTIFVADNGSTDGSLKMMYDSFGEVPIIKFEKNWGFTGGYNRAFEEISKMNKKFDYYLLLNSDVEVSANWLSSLVSFMDSHSKAGICSPKVLSYDRRDYFEHAGACGGYIDYFGFPYCRGRVMNKIEKDNGQYDTPCEIFWASGTSLMIRSELWHRLGGLDESFFAHMEEIDMCWRAKLLGEEIWVVPQSSIYHVGGGTLPNNSSKKLYLNFRNNLLMLHKNLPKGSAPFIIFLRMCIDGVIGCIYLLTGKWSYFHSVVCAHHDYLKMKKHTPRTISLTKVSLSHKILPQLLLRAIKLEKLNNTL